MEQSELPAIEARVKATIDEIAAVDKQIAKEVRMRVDYIYVCVCICACVCVCVCVCCWTNQQVVHG